MAKEKKPGLVEKSENDIEKQPTNKETVVETPATEEVKQEVAPEDEGLKTRGYRSLKK
jgi:hypothetical protein